MPVITITSDCKPEDTYSGLVKNRLYELCPGVILVDLATVKAFSRAQAAIMVKLAFPNFPAGSVHIIAVNTIFTENEPLLAAKCQGHFFVGTDNGIFNLIFDDSPFKAFRVNLKIVDYHPTFPELGLFTYVASFLALGNSIEKLGHKVERLHQAKPFIPIDGPNYLEGMVIYIDSYSNAITNISRKKFETVCNGRSFKIFLKSERDVIDHISLTYQGNKPTDLVAVFNSAGLLEIAAYQARLCELYNIDTSTNINIKFYDNANH